MVTNDNLLSHVSHVNHFRHCRPASVFVTLTSQMADGDFEDWVKALLDRHFGGSFQRFADQAGVTYSALKRSVKKGSTSVETLLRIAIHTGEPAKDVFEAAGKGHVHELIEQVYGEAASVSFSKDARDIALAFDAETDPVVKGYAKKSILALLPGPPPEDTNGPSNAKRAATSGTGGRRVRRRAKG